MTDYLILPKEFSLQQIVLHRLAKICWGDFVLRENMDPGNIFLLRETRKLAAHREKKLGIVSQISKKLPKLLENKLINSIFCLQQGYLEALIWEKKCEFALSFTILNPKTAGVYQAGNYIDPLGHFNELVWAKRFVADENHFEQHRFEVACLYCFEHTILEIWHSMRKNRLLLCDGDLTCIRSCYCGDGDLVVFWVYQLENKFDELIEENSDYEDGFNVCGLIEAIASGHEYAARFFWKRFSDHEKAEFLQEPEFDLLSVAAENNHAGLVSFIYSILPSEQKNNLVSWTIQNNETLWVWHCLLYSRYYECVLNDILNSTLHFPTKIYRRILTSLTFRMVESSFPAYKTVFKLLWSHLSQAKRTEILETASYAITNLTRIKAMDLLKIIILPLSHRQKEEILFYDWQCGGISALAEFSKVGDYDALRHYLLFFLIDRNATTQKLTLRIDAISFLDRFIKSEPFIAWTEREIPESEKKEVSKVIENLKDSLKVPDLLLDKVEQEN